ncbi:MAG: cyanoexosortase B system-associated protein [Phormidesmis sp.]
MSSYLRSTTVTKKSIATLIVIAILALFVAISAVPHYLSSWPWATPLKVPNQPALQAIRDQGITLPGWLSQEQIKTKIGGHTWSIQQLSAADESPFAAASPSTIFLLLRPQVWEADQPEVEWLDLKGSQQWQTDSHQSLPFEITQKKSDNSDNLSKTVRISTDYFRAWNKDQTYAILQWYASPIGGSASPAWWFWADQNAQWRHRQRMPWVAVSIWLPIDPLSDIIPHQEMAVALGQSVQAELLQTVFIQKLSVHPSPLDQIRAS